MSPALVGGFFTTSATWEANWTVLFKCICIYVALVIKTGELAYNLVISIKNISALSPSLGGAVTTLDSSGFTGASWGSGFPLPALCQGAFMEGDESPWNDKV